MWRMKNARTGVSMTTFTQAVKSEIGVIQGFMQNKQIADENCRILKIAAMLKFLR
jgi:hypothetical protein